MECVVTTQRRYGRNIDPQHGQKVWQNSKKKNLGYRILVRRQSYIPQMTSNFKCDFELPPGVFSVVKDAAKIFQLELEIRGARPTRYFLKQKAGNLKSVIALIGNGHDPVNYMAEASSCLLGDTTCYYCVTHTPEGLARIDRVGRNGKKKYSQAKFKWFPS